MFNIGHNREKAVKMNLMIKYNQLGGTTEADKIINKIGSVSGMGLYEKTRSKQNKLFDFIGTTYHNKGYVTAIYRIEASYPTTSEMTVPYSKDLILRIFNPKFNHPEYLTNLMTKHANNKEYCPDNIPDFYYYGDIYNNNDVLMGKYIITRKYHTIEELVKQPLNIRLTVLLNGLLLQNKFYNDKIIHSDLKPENIGYDDFYNYVIIDYDEITILPINNYDREFLKIMEIRNVYGSLYPAYIFNNDDQVRALNGQIRKINTSFTTFIVITNGKKQISGTYHKPTVQEMAGIDKIYSTGLAMIIAQLFFKDESYKKLRDLYPGSKRVNYNFPIIQQKIRDSIKMDDITDGSCIEILKDILVNLLTSTYYHDVYVPSQIIDKILNIQKSNIEYPSVFKFDNRIYKHTNTTIKNNTIDYDYFNITNENPIKVDPRDILLDTEYYLYKQI